MTYQADSKQHANVGYIGKFVIAGIFGGAALFSSNVANAAFVPTDIGFSSNGAQDGAELFSVKDTDGGADDIAAFLLFEGGSFAPNNTFGIYAAGNTSTTLQVFSGANSPSFIGKTIRWDPSGSVCIWSGSACVGSSVTGIDKNNFGFYLTSPQGSFFSETNLNTDGFDHLLSFFVNGDGGMDYVFGWEDLKGGGDKDYDDMVVGIHDVNAVPIPAAAWLLGSALMGLVLINRRPEV